jgi:hypothetical protein
MYNKLNILSLLLLCILPFVSINYGQTKQDIEDMVKNLNNADGENVNIMHEKITKAFMVQDSIFFEVMNNNKNTFIEWLNNLQYLTFSIAVPETTFQRIEKILQTAYFQKMKDIMVADTKKYLTHKDYGNNAKMLLKKLNSIKIRFID